MNKDIDIQEFKHRLNRREKMNVIDVREEWEYEEYNIGTQLIPLNSIPHRLSEISDLKEKEIIVHCQSGNRSRQAKIYLTSKGFKNVRSLLGGLIALRENGSFQDEWSGAK